MTPDYFSDIPADKRLRTPLDLPSPLSEPELLAELQLQSEKNSLASPFLGAGNSPHFIPSALKHLVGRSEFYTAYTPYQAEASQGTLQAIYEYQSMICSLTGMEAANASLYDGATALAEAAFMACRLTGKKEVAVSAAVHPHYRQVLKTYCRAASIKLTEVPYNPDTGLATGNLQLATESACFILQQPNFFGCIEEVKGLAEKIHALKALFIVAVDPLSLGLLTPPGQYGADIVVGEGQALGNPQNFGGPGLGIFATKKEYLRQLPGRIVGATVDAEGNRGFVLTLATREQHIRRERATSNICSNEALCALSACVYLALMGKSGMRKVAELILQNSNYLKSRIAASAPGKIVFPAPTFSEFAVKSDLPLGLNLGDYYPELKGDRLIAVNELVNKKQLDELVSRFGAG